MDHLDGHLITGKKQRKRRKVREGEREKEREETSA